MQKEYTPPPVKLFSEQLQVRLFPDNADLSTLLKIEIMARDGKANYPNDLRLEVTNLFWPIIRDKLLRESTESKEGSLINSVANNLKRNYTEHWIQRYHHPLTRWKIDLLLLWYRLLLTHFLKKKNCKTIFWNDYFCNLKRIFKNQIENSFALLYLKIVVQNLYDLFITWVHPHWITLKVKFSRIFFHKKRKKQRKRNSRKFSLISLKKS